MFTNLLILFIAVVGYCNFFYKKYFQFNFCNIIYYTFFEIFLASAITAPSKYKHKCVELVYNGDGTKISKVIQ